MFETTNQLRFSDKARCLKKKKRHLRSAFRCEFLHRQFLLAKPAVKAAVPASENSSLAKNDHHDVHKNVILLFCWENAIQSFALESSLILSTKLGSRHPHGRHPRHPRHKDSRSCGTQVINSVIFKTFHAIPSSSQTPST